MEARLGVWNLVKLQWNLKPWRVLSRAEKYYGSWWGTDHKQAKSTVIVWIQSHDALNWILAGKIVGCVIFEI